jgi:hypothetical protein
MKIAVLGWGSLIWDPKELNILDDKWNENGPILPIEFARVSKDGRLTLVIKPNWTEVKTMYAISSFQDLTQAIENLRNREQTIIDRIGFYNFLTDEKHIREGNNFIIPNLISWQAQNYIDAVIWTDLPPNFQDLLKLHFNLENIEKVLKGLKKEEFEFAKKYINNTPAQITTRFRPEITQFLEAVDNLHKQSVSIDVPKREALLEHLHKYSASLSKYPEKYIHLFFNSSENTPAHFAYICPICVKHGIIYLDDKYIVTTKTGMTLDHFPPESVGGNETLLVCRDCNSKAGSGYEYVLAQKIAEVAFNSGTANAVSKAKTEISGVKGRYNSKVSIGENGKLIISFKPNKKAHTPLLDQFLEKSADDLNWTAQLTIQSANEKKVSLSLLKAAYLFCFESWGYEFVFSSTGKSIRKILNDEGDYPLENPSFWIGDVVKKGQAESLPIGVCYLQNPKDWELFIVNIVLKDLSTRYENVVSVLIPGPDGSNWLNLDETRMILDSGQEITLTMAHVTKDLLSYGELNGYTKNWEMIKSLK